MAREALQLPVSVVSPGDLNRLLRELDAIDEQLLQLQLRKAGSGVKLPKTSRLLDQTIELNGLNLLQAPHRLELRHTLQAIRQRTPVLHMTFGSDPSPDFLAKLMTWLRREIHPFVLLTIGLQPNIGAGCILRTANHSFDLSLMQSFKRQQHLLLDRLATPAPVPTPVAAQTAETVS